MATSKENKKKVCPICGKPKSIATGFYKSSSPLYQEDKCVPICICCVKDGIINSEDGTINKTKLKTMLQRLDKPLYWDDLDSAYAQYKREHSYLSDDEVAKHGKDIVGLYFKNAMLRQNHLQIQKKIIFFILIQILLFLKKTELRKNIWVLKTHHL